MKKRIGIIALLHESNTFLERPTTLQDFEGNLLVTGERVLEACRGTQHEVGGFIEAVENSPDAEAVGIFAARAMPYGPITSEAWDTLTSQLVNQVRQAGALDGLLVAPHGATVAENARDADGDWLSRLRQEVGPDLPIIGTLDLHANVSPLMASSCDALLGYRTNPHLDQKQRGLDAGALLLRTLRGEIRPCQKLIQIPLCVNIERQATSEPHGQKLWAEADRLARDIPGVLSVSCLYGFPYSDVEEMGAVVLAVVDGNPSLAEETARHMADFWWEMRGEFSGQMISVDQAVSLALEERSRVSDKPVGLLDMGDNVGGGSAGDGTIIAAEWLQKGGGPLLAVLYDPEAVHLTEQAGVGESVRLKVGGKTDSLHGAPLEGEFTVLKLCDGKFSETEVRHGGYSHFDQGRIAILRSAAGLTILATSLRCAPLSLQQILAFGLVPSDYAAIVIKGVHAPVAAYAGVCSRMIRVNTSGATCADLQAFDFSHRRRPMFPFDPAVSRTA